MKTLFEDKMLKHDGKLKELYLKITALALANKEISLFIAAAIVCLSVGLIKSTGPTSDKPALASPESFDTYIPDGFSLVPIEVANYETLDSLLGPFGVVDIFAADPGNPDSSKRIAYRVKIVRAPRNPSHFAVLVPFNEVHNILKYPGPFMVSVQNPKVSGTGFEKGKTRKRSRIIFNTGD
jgi:hypothetical protein